MKLYCNNCFSKTEYKFSKPKFCPECGFKNSSSAPEAPSLIESDSSHLKRIKDLEKQLSEFKNTKAGMVRNLQNDSDNDSDSVEDESEYDYQQTQYHINNFKKNKNKSAVIIEKDDSDRGISFGKLIENSSASNRSTNQDFKINTANSIQKTNAQILEEIRIEASSISRTIEID
jgi:hypothetical protein